MVSFLKRYKIHALTFANTATTRHSQRAGREMSRIATVQTGEYFGFISEGYEYFLRKYTEVGTPLSCSVEVLFTSERYLLLLF